MPEGRSVLRVPPHNLDAERAVLGACMVDPDAIAEASARCAPTDFYGHDNANAFASVLDLYAAGEVVLPGTLLEAMRRAGTLGSVTGLDLLKFLSNAPTTRSAAQFAGIVHDYAGYRSMIAALGDGMDQCYEARGDLAEVAARIEESVFGLLDRGRGDDPLMPEMVDEFLTDLDAIMASDGRTPGLPTGFYDLDDRLTGLHPSTLLIIGARTSMGKSSLGLDIARHAAVQSRVPVLFFSLEMNRMDLLKRLHAAEGRVDLQRLRSGRGFTEQDSNRISLAAQRLAGAPLHIDTKSRTLMEMRTKARRLTAKFGQFGLIVVDYLQLMDGVRAENRQLEVAGISRGLKIMAGELNLPVIAMSQLSRNLEQRGDKRPMLSDLRESGAIEQDADVVIGLHREEVFNPDTQDKGMAELIILKHRNGPTGLTRLAWHDRFTCFESMARM